MTGDLLLLLVGFGVGAIAGGWWMHQYIRRDLIAAEAHVDGWRKVARTLSGQIEGMLRQRRGCNGCAKIGALVEYEQPKVEAPGEGAGAKGEDGREQGEGGKEQGEGFRVQDEEEPWARPASWWRAQS